MNKITEISTIGDHELVTTAKALVAGFFITALSFSKGKIKETYGLWDKYVV